MYVKLELNQDPIFLYNFATILGDPIENTLDYTCESLRVLQDTLGRSMQRGRWQAPWKTVCRQGCQRSTH